VVTPEGLPLAYEVLPGNTADKTTLRGFLERIDEPVKLLTRKRGIVDLMLSRSQKRHRADDYEHLVVELKAPKGQAHFQGADADQRLCTLRLTRPALSPRVWRPLALLACVRRV
jgi:hypothetical protein